MKYIFAVLLVLVGAVSFVGIVVAEEVPVEARQQVESYYAALKKEDLDKAKSLFTPSAELNMTWKYGNELPDESLTLTIHELEQVLKPEVLAEMPELMKGYKELSRTSEITSANTDKEQVVIVGQQTIRYQITYENSPWEGEAKENDTFTLIKEKGEWKISELKSVTDYQ
ncbi:DUF4829 domain-containing protein [Endozoicomonas arenosclerae]|uniref:DUF4829 domain-containing protein n=1 Tax=Endozoicomonas arenosclerae TaxID=1633495 RepID=UPI0007819F63|nr:DUF4829 domain-containing protein [Endozoicomonas arenosclerae]